MLRRAGTVVIKKSASAEVARLLDALLSADPVAAEAAAARLAIVGPRAVERLASTLSGLRDATQLLAVLEVLERIADPRAGPAAEPFLTDTRAVVAVAAVNVVRRLLQAEDPEVAARAADALVAVVLGGTTHDAGRQAAIEGLNDLPDDVIAPLRTRLGEHVLRPAHASGSPSARAGRPALPPPVVRLDQMLNASLPLPPVGDVRQAVAQMGPAAPLAQLHRLVQRLRQVEAGATPDQAAAWRDVRGLVHQALAARRSRVALYDLRETLERAPEDVTMGMVAAITALADATCLDAVADAWARTGDRWLKAHWQDVFAAVVSREGLTRRHAVLRRIAARHPALLAGRVSTPSRTRPSPSPGDRT